MHVEAMAVKTDFYLRMHTKLAVWGTWDEEVVEEGVAYRNNPFIYLEYPN